MKTNKVQAETKADTVKQITAIDEESILSNTQDRMMKQVVTVADLVVSTRIYQSRIHKTLKQSGKTQN